MRSKEENGREYHFVSEGEFEELRNREHIFDESLLNGFRYGTPLRVIRQIIHNGETGFFHLSTAACLKLRGAIAPCACVFLLPENKVQLISQMSDRGMTAEAIERRLAMDPVDWERLLEFDLLIMSKPGDASYAADRIEAWLRERSDNG
jgi:guanylate kinase